MATWITIARLSDGVFVRGGAFGVTFDPGTEVEVTTDVETRPDARLERYDAASPTKRRPATVQELADGALVAADEQAVLSAKDKALLSTCATVLEKFDPTWAAMTTPQKKAAVNALAARWTFWRSWAERNL